MAPIDDLDPSAGNYVKGIKLDDNTFLATTSFNQLKAITRDPQLLQPSSRPRAGVDAMELEDEAALHQLVQRMLTGTKKKNVAPYAEYIVRHVQGAVGVLPPIHLWTTETIQLATNNTGTFALIPHDDHLLAIDGETQLTAHYRVAEMPGITAEVRAAHRKFPLSAIIHHGVPVASAQQFFHDLNLLGVQPSTSLGLAMDTNDPLMRVVGHIEEIPVLRGRVDRQARQLTKSSSKLVTLQALRQMIVNVAKGISGVQYGAKPAPLDGVDLADLEAVAREVVETYFEVFQPQIADREGSLAGSAAVLAAVGAMGNEVFTAMPYERPQRMQELMASLQAVDWTKGQHWVGIAGNFTPNGVFSVKGTKEVSYSVFNTLSDHHNPNYGRVRHTV